jgi:hypothetical protein
MDLPFRPFAVDEPLVMQAARISLEIMGQEGLNLDPDDLMPILVQYRESFQIYGPLYLKCFLSSALGDWRSERNVAEQWTCGSHSRQG